MMARNVDLTIVMLDHSCWKLVSVFIVHLTPGLLMIKRNVGLILVKKHKNYSKMENAKRVLNTQEPKATKKNNAHPTNVQTSKN